MYEKELFDETLDINSTNNYEISIQIGLNGFSFCLLDNLRNRFVMFRDYKLSAKEAGIIDEIRDIAEKDEFLSREYRRYRILFNTEQSTIVPATLYDPAVKNEYFELNHKLRDNYMVSNNKLTEPDAYLLFGVRKDIFDLAINLFPEASISHQVKPLLNSSFRQARKNKERYIRVHFDRGFFTMIIIADNELQFFNSFRVRNDSDILYYLLNSFNRFEVNNDQKVYLSGNISKFDDLYNNLLRYIKTLKFSTPEGDFSMSYIFDEMATHQYCNLFNIVNCA
ncbi:MAG: DUF3822 family protein [Bacteroidales bacterium]|jgi:hypothetical protein|nr:DUF3822 family protein [Bacteroidales bacterium]